uniref:Zinc finger protein 646 n=1 Tax=Pelodiscus sinensis TaxID=13735 RepID=K7FD49_PELSI
RAPPHAGSLVNHRRTHEVGLFTCLLCRKEFSNPMALKNHLRIHTEERRHRCLDCGRTFRVASQLASHHSSAHAGRGLKEEEEEENNFQQGQDSSSSDAVPVEERRYKCNQCDKAYKHAGSL